MDYSIITSENFHPVTWAGDRTKASNTTGNISAVVINKNQSSNIILTFVVSIEMRYYDSIVRL